MKKLLIIVLALCMVGMYAVPMAAAQPLKIAVAATDKTQAASVSGLAGRSPYYLIFDGSGTLLEAMENPYMSARGGAGIGVANFLAQKGVTVVVAGVFGPRMANALQMKGIKHIEFKGSVDDAVKKALGSK